MTLEEYNDALYAAGCARGNKGEIPARDGSTLLVYAVRGTPHDLYLTPASILTCEQRKAQLAGVIRQIAALRSLPPS